MTAGVMSALPSENFAVRPVTAGLFQLGEQPAHALLDLIDRADMGEGAAAEFGGARHQEGVRRRADADHEHARAAAHRRDGVEQLLLVADRAVGQEHHLADVVGVIAGVVGQRRAHRRHHLGAAAACSALDERRGPAEMFPASAGTDAGNSTSMVSSKRITLKRSAGCSRPSA